LLTLAVLLIAAPVSARNHDKEAAKAREERLVAVTVFVDANWGNRTNGAARALTDMHQAWGRQGYQLVSLQPYDENGDLVGFFISYRLEPATAGAPQ
jgi:hypothetical protein